MWLCCGCAAQFSHRHTCCRPANFCYRFAIVVIFLVLVSMARWKDICFYLVLSGLMYIVNGINREYRIYTDCRRRQLTSEGSEFIANCHDMWRLCTKFATIFPNMNMIYVFCAVLVLNFLPEFHIVLKLRWCTIFSMHNLSRAMQRNGAAAAGSPALQDHFQTISVKFWPDAATNA